MIELTVVYCEGWDYEGRRLVGPLPEAVARERDEAGEQYAVVFVGDDGQAAAVTEICWQANHLSVSHVDGSSELSSQSVHRRLADRMLTVRIQQWNPESLAEFTGTGRRELTTRAGQGTQVTIDQIDVDEITWPIPAFGDWARFARLDDATFTQAPDPSPYVPTEERPWQAPKPLQPGDLAAMFRAAGEVVPAGVLRMPSGSLIVIDPGYLGLGHQPRPFTATAPPGEYPVELAVVDGRTAGARVIVSHEPVATWELALREGQDPRQLGNKEFYGFGVDSGQACFLDAAAMPGLDEAGDDLVDDLTDTPEDGSVSLDDPRTGANLVAFWSGPGDGAYPVWVGRTESGQAACFVADFLMIRQED
ncbi:hypothetical protein JOF56_010854 [Kibdelosporangium banguiense]|uniref:DUF4241 domain-containing protein n=1 Tax=Kibdelosporangium banguiense TaxID=1365924 RepID=A0ABS4U1D7_9PSEU|nr:DUF4241 domain-containing protein [Kibdelosporangium banguiense]MBP2330469.1 hypothetical protein [Kibdelosporangium banguiense]